jgi:hypothetical protein
VLRQVICGGFLSAAVFLSPSLVLADKPQRIVSLSVCADLMSVEIIMESPTPGGGEGVQQAAGG